MKTLKYLTLLLITSMLFLNMDCENENECEVITQAPLEFLDYWFFPVGSWWVYKNQNGELDTATCTISDSSFYQMNDPDGIPPYCKWIYNSRLEHSNDNYFRKKYQENVQYFESVNSVDNKYFLVIGCGSRYSPYGGLLVYPFKINDTIEYQIISGEKHLNYIADTTSLKIDNIIFMNSIHVIKYREGNLPEIFLNEVWFSKSFGIIKMSFANGNYWELIDYKINK